MNPDADDRISPLVFFDESGQPVSTRFGDVYFSRENGLDESRYVFIENNHLTERWRNLEPNSTFLIAETGFGTGLNFLATWAHWKENKPARCSRLHFFSVEKFPLTRQQLTRALSLWPELQTLSDVLISHYPPENVRGIHRLSFDNSRVSLTLFFGEAAEGLAQLSPLAAPVDAWYLDGFAPAKNPEMWNDNVFEQIARVSSGGTTFSTFTAAGTVKRGLQEFGFHCRKVKGFGRKRDMLVGTFNQAFGFRHEGEKKTSGTVPNWCHQSHRARPVRSALVVGGGLAGCHTAYALANRNIKVTLVERDDNLASRGSGNPQGVVYTKLSAHPGALSSFNLYAQLYANQFYSTNHFFNRCGDQCGVLHLAKDEKTADSLAKLGEEFQSDFARFVSTAETEQVAGLSLHYSGLYIEKSGWLNPVELCQLLTEHPNIEVITGFATTQLNYLEQHRQWQACNAQSDKSLTADIAVLATARDAKAFNSCRHLPLKSIRGQISYLPANATTQLLRCVVCGDGYIAPAAQGMHYCGATYTLNNYSTDTTIEEHRENINNIVALGRDFEFDDQLALSISGRVGFRCTTPDYFPIVGPAPIYQEMVETFSFLRKKANAAMDETGRYYPGLYLNLGYGSRGLAYAPLCGELLASIVCFEPLPVSGKMYAYLNPARFIIRDLQRNKI